MSKFIFRYQKILDIKLKKEDHVKMLLSEAYNNLEQEKTTLNKLNELLNSITDDYRSKMNDGCSCQELKQCNIHICYMRDKIKFQMGVIEGCINKVEEVKLQLLDAMKERKTFEKLREKKYEEFVELAKKAEEAIIDQIVTYKNSTL